MMRSKNTKPGSHRIAHKRCPRCKKVRVKWFDANYVWCGSPRKMWQHYEGQLICHICAERLGLPPKLAPSAEEIVKLHAKYGYKPV
jgi:hypothetical protein